ncbi:MAG: DUF998 domain-containing protein [Chloroflexi bacterium]|nr:MAG: DUF998 domain-containing protein [Chloroflexota bacterium]
MRPGFDITRHNLRLLANGDLGWIQITNLVVTGVIFFAAFVGIATGSGQAWSVIGFWIGVVCLGMDRSDGGTADD